VVLIQELSAEASIILFAIHIATEVVGDEAREPAFWKECVAASQDGLVGN
jgi:hypothetical protein